jgi:PleD family two-component response regulator
MNGGAKLMSKPTPKRIMVFNDAKEFLLLVEGILTPEGFEVILDTYSSDEHVRIEAAKPDLLILDGDFSSTDKAWGIIQ